MFFVCLPEGKLTHSSPVSPLLQQFVLVALGVEAQDQRADGQGLGQRPIDAACVVKHGEKRKNHGEKHGEKQWDLYELIIDWFMIYEDFMISYDFIWFHMMWL